MFTFLFPVGFVAAIVHVSILIIFSFFVNYIQKNGRNLPLNILAFVSALASVTFLGCVVLMFITFYSFIFNATSVLIVVGMVLLFLNKKRTQSKKDPSIEGNAEVKITHFPLSTIVYTDSMYLLTMLIFLIPFFATMIFK